MSPPPSPIAVRNRGSELGRLLRRQPVVFLDGGLATELQARGADLDDPLWSARLLVEQPALIEQLHHDYFVAGADVAIAASYQASFPGFAARGIDAEAAAALMRRAVELARSARDRFWSVPDQRRGRERPLVAASVGPYGATLADGSEYHGRYELGGCCRTSPADITALREQLRPQPAPIAPRRTG